MRNLSVLIDGYNLALEKGTGIATYARNLSHIAHEVGAEVSILYGLPFARSQTEPLLNEIRFFDSLHRPSKARAPFLGSLTPWLDVAADSLRGAAAFEIPKPSYVIHEAFQSRLPYFDHILNANSVFERSRLYFSKLGKLLPIKSAIGIDIAHWTYPIPARIIGARNIYTIHDLVPLKLPHATLDKRKRFLRVVRAIAGSCDAIVTVSANSKSDIMATLHLDDSKVFVTHQAILTDATDSRESIDAVAERVERLLRVKRDGYFLFLGAIEPKKNVGRLIEAFLSAQTEKILLLVGEPAWMAENELRLLNSNDPGVQRLIRNRVRLLGYLPTPTVTDLLRCARGLIFPSLYEGFGLPVLEAMRLGTPVITSSTSSLPEIGGEAVLYAHPYRTQDLRAAIERLSSDDELVARLRASGPIQALKFNSEVYATKVRHVYDSIMSRQRMRDKKDG